MQSIEDYFTIKKENDEYKLNINSYIGKRAVNKEFENDKIKIIIENVKVYMDYQLYNIKVYNKTTNPIMLDTKQKTNTMYITDENDIKYMALGYEIADDMLKILGNNSNKLEIKYNISYSSRKKINKMTFKDIILNYDEYMNVNDKEKYNKEQINISF